MEEGAARVAGVKLGGQIYTYRRTFMVFGTRGRQGGAGGRIEVGNLGGEEDTFWPRNGVERRLSITALYYSAGCVGSDY